MRRPYRVLARVLALGMLAGAAGCVVDDPGHPRGFPEAASVDETTASASPTALAAPALTDARARSALLRQDDLGDAWSGTQGAATWRDGLLKGRTDRSECQPLLDGIYAEDVLGEPRGGTAVTGFDDYEYGAQLRYQVGAYDKADVDARLRRLGQLVGECEEFTITGVQGREYGAEVAPVELPGNLGDARQGLRLTVSGDPESDESALTLDLATVRVGDTAALLTHGGLYGIDDTATTEAAKAGIERLQTLLKEEKEKKEEKKKPKKPKKPEKATKAPGTKAPSGEQSADSGQDDGSSDEARARSASRTAALAASATPPPASA
ncbi:hypothetical protein IHE56_06480 [Streptomyces sp. ID01-12c]|uniref:hypothetical protein n=2 Tax=Streptomyces caniscabiei TaxID=2746961 RepID=UPI00178364A8|nr:hypothetical protein [Streptomyces caniscabiei]MBD9701740.1 hypothetical protein [Streptomyces caniscabiei]MDX3726436.1 hypothetical protein [Streptomyces caniscabiei]